MKRKTAQVSQFASILILVSITLIILGASRKKTMNGFDLSRHSIPVDEIMSGGPPRDGIPSLTDPEFISASDATYLNDDDRVLGLLIGGIAKAYPIKILNWHEIVNDQFDGKPVVITYCPLCGTGMAFDSVLQEKRIIFGVSGLLYNSDVLFYDKQTESLWSQIKQEAVTGPLRGTRLKLLFLLHTTWGAWRSEHPNSLALSKNTGHRRNYQRDPYKDYAETASIMFPVNKRDLRIQPKEWILGVEIEGEARAYPFSALALGPSVIQDQVRKKTILIHYDSESRTAYITDKEGDQIPSIVGYWFAWYAFYPYSTVYEPVTVPQK